MATDDPPLEKTSIPPAPAGAADVDPASLVADEDDESSLPDVADESVPGAGALVTGRAVIAEVCRHAPQMPGVYRMLSAGRDVLYVGKAKNVRKRVASYTRPTGLSVRIQRMVAATAAMEIITTATETEALLLEANLIRQLKPRFNVLMRDDKSFPYILITGDHWAPQLLKHRGAQTRKGQYFGPFASAGAVNRTLAALQRAFLIRSCTDSFFESRTRPCLMHQIKRCAGPCTHEVDFAGYAELVREARDFLSGKSHAVQKALAAEMEKASEALAFERAALYRDRLAALSAIQTQQGVNPRTVVDADVFAVTQDGGYFCVEVFFFRAGQNWGNRAYFPRADRTLSAAAVLGPFLAQFYGDKPPPRLILLSEEIEERDLLMRALSLKAGTKVEITVPQRGEKKELVQNALANARDALGRKLAETATQTRLLEAMAERLALPRVPRRIEVYDNSHIQGTNAVGAMIVAGPEGFQKKHYRKFNIRSASLTPGDDYAMMREVLQRRFKRMLAAQENKASVEPAISAALSDALAATPLDSPPDAHPEDEPESTPWQAPDLVVIDGGLGQLNAARAALAELGLGAVIVMAVAKGPDRDAGRETLFLPDRPAIKLEPRDPVLYFIQRLRDEAHRFVITSHRTLRKKSMQEAGLQEISGIGPTRKRALLLHFGTLKAIENAALADLEQVPGINAETARRIYDYFHTAGAPPVRAP